MHFKEYFCTAFFVVVSKILGTAHKHILLPASWLWNRDHYAGEKCIQSKNANNKNGYFTDYFVWRGNGGFCSTIPWDVLKTDLSVIISFPTNHFMSMVRYLRLSCQYKVFLQIKQEPTKLKSSLMNLNFERNKHTKVPKDKDRRMGNVVAKRNNSQVILMPWVGEKAAHAKRFWDCGRSRS